MSRRLPVLPPVGELRHTAKGLLQRSHRLIGEAAMTKVKARLKGGPMEEQHKALGTLVEELLRERRSERRWKAVRRMLLALFFLAPSVVYGIFAWKVFIRQAPEAGGGAVVALDGEIGSGTLEPARVIQALGEAFEKAKVVILRIDSPGGGAVAAERIGAAIDHLKKAHPKPIEAVIEGLGASAAYMIATHADRIYVGRYSLVGSIGAMLSTWDLHGLAKRLEIGKRIYASGPLKDMMNPFEPPTDLEVRKATELVRAMGMQFAEAVKASRGEKLKAELGDIATGELWSGVQAVEMGLADGIATLEEVARKHGVELVDYGPKEDILQSIAKTFFHALSALAGSAAVQ